MYIVLEGSQGSGKTLQSKKLKKNLEQKFPDKKFKCVREPGNTEIAEAIRTLVQGTKFQERMHAITDSYLYAAARAQLLNTVVVPALEEGYIVISDRSFITSLAIQGYAQGLGIDYVLEVNKHAINGTIPDFVVYLDVDLDICIQRTFDHDGDKFETADKEFLAKMEEGYREIQKLDMFKDKWINIDGNRSRKEVQNEILEKIVPKIEN